jgi:hypothetical protein
MFTRRLRHIPTACAGLLAACLCAAMLPAGMGADDGKQTEGKGALAKGSYQIRNVRYSDSDMVLRPRGASGREGTPIVLYPRTDWKCLTWKVEPAEEGARLVNHFTNKTFQPADPKPGEASSAVVQVTPAAASDPAQRWKFVPLGGGTYRIEHAATGRALTAEKDGDGVQVRIAPWEGRDDQKWQVLDGPTHFSG